MIDFIKFLWVLWDIPETMYIVYTLGIVLMHDIMDYMDFCFPRNNGFWSIHTEPDMQWGILVFHFDCWHTAKKVFYAILFYSWVGICPMFFILVLISFVEHHIVFHMIMSEYCWRKR